MNKFNNLLWNQDNKCFNLLSKVFNSNFLFNLNERHIKRNQVINIYEFII